MHGRLFGFLAIGTLLSGLLTLLLGSDVVLSVSDTISVLLGIEGSDPTAGTIIWLIRLPRLTTAILAGAALGVGGLLMQTLFRNPLAGPFVLGIQSGASLGAALVILAGTTIGIGSISFLPDFGIAVGASLGAGALLAAVLLVSRYVVQATTLLILGLLFGYATGAIVSILASFAETDSLRLFVEWGFGSFKGVTRTQLGLLAGIVIFGLVLSVSVSKPLNGMLLGETYARSMGINVGRVRTVVIIATALLAGGVTAFCGPVVFIGVAVPHLCRSMARSTDHRILIPAVALLGALLAIWADLLAQVPFSPMQLPLNALTALIGTPVITWVILRNRNIHTAFS